MISKGGETFQRVHSCYFFVGLLYHEVFLSLLFICNAKMIILVFTENKLYEVLRSIHYG